MALDFDFPCEGEILSVNADPRWSLTGFGETVAGLHRAFERGIPVWPGCYYEWPAKGCEALSYFAAALALSEREVQVERPKRARELLKGG